MTVPELAAELKDQFVARSAAPRRGGASLLDFTNSGPDRRPGGDRRRLDSGDRRTWRRAVARRPRARHRQCDRLQRRRAGRRRLTVTRTSRGSTLDAITAYAEDVRAGRRSKVDGRRSRRRTAVGPSMATAVIDGIRTRYEVFGAGPPLLMFSPGGFDATIEKWTTQGIYAADQAARPSVDAATPASRSTVARAASRAAASKPSRGRTTSRRARGCSTTWRSIARTSWAPAWAARRRWRSAVAHPEVTSSLLLYWPVGGAHYRINSHARFAEHLDVRPDRRGSRASCRSCRRKESRSTRIRAVARGRR